MSQKHKNKESILEEVSNFLQLGLFLEGEILKAGEKIRELSKVAYKQEWLDSRLQLLSIIAYLQEFKSNIPGNTNAEINERITLLTSFAQGVPISETLISEGQYIKATAVVKQDYEILTRIREVKLGKAIPGKVPNVSFAPKGTQRFYGDLNNIAHPSNIHLLKDLIQQFHTEDIHGISAIPVFNPAIACSLYELHVWLLVEITREWILLSCDMYGDDPGIKKAMRWFLGVIEILKKAGFTVTP
jgi:hypothetical protein